MQKPKVPCWQDHEANLDLIAPTVRLRISMSSMHRTAHCIAAYKQINLLLCSTMAELQWPHTGVSVGIQLT